jgi:hypothetical protein
LSGWFVWLVLRGWFARLVCPPDGNPARSSFGPLSPVLQPNAEPGADKTPQNWQAEGEFR